MCPENQAWESALSTAEGSQHWKVVIVAGESAPQVGQRLDCDVPPPPPNSHMYPGLSDEQKERIAAHLSQGLSPDSIAGIEHISAQTI